MVLYVLMGSNLHQRTNYVQKYQYDHLYNNKK